MVFSSSLIRVSSAVLLSASLEMAASFSSSLGWYSPRSWVSISMSFSRLFSVNLSFINVPTHLDDGYRFSF